MMKQIALIASIISGITAVTTSLRALGKSREMARHNLESQVHSGCRINDDRSCSSSPGSSLAIHFIVTVIWFLLSVIAAIPLLESENSDVLFLRLAPFLFLVLLLSFIWWKTLRRSRDS